MRSYRLSDGYESIINYVLHFGAKRQSRQGPVRETEDVLIAVDYGPALVGFPGYRHPVGLTEAAQIIAGRYDLAQLEKFAPHFADYSDGWGAYSSRLRDQIPALLRELQQNPDTRRAVLAPWDAELDLTNLAGRPAGEQHLDHPCTLSLGFRIRDGRLNMTVTMRSNDLWLGAPVDWTMFGVLQATLASCLGCEPGTYVHLAHSLHIYERNVEKIVGWLETFDQPGEITAGALVTPFGTGTWASAQDEARAALAGEVEATRSRSARELAQAVRGLA